MSKKLDTDIDFNFNVFETVERALPIKPMINIGSCLDIPTCTVELGMKDESIINGGLGNFTGAAGKGNTFKTTVLDGMIYIGMERISSFAPANYLAYDTEVNNNERHQSYRISNFKYLKKLHPVESGLFRYSDKVSEAGNKFYDKLMTVLRGKSAKDTKTKMVATPFKYRDTGKPLMVPMPSGGKIDSLSDFTVEADAKNLAENELGDSGGNTLFMRNALMKTRMMLELPEWLIRSSHYLGMVSQVGDEVAMASGPTPPAPKKQLQDMKNGQILKGVGSKFTFATTICWNMIKATPMWNGYKPTDGALYPIESGANKTSNDNDLYEVEMKCIRNKNGPTGFIVNAVVSQSKGLLGSLTEFHFIKSNNYFGLIGSNQNYVSALMPEVKLQRTTIRTKLNENPRLARSINIMSELLQFNQMKPQYVEGIWCDMETLYSDLKKMGYDWNELLDTRGWWAFNQYDHPEFFLSSIDLLRMRAGLYVPYWMDPQTKRASKEYLDRRQAARDRLELIYSHYEKYGNKETQVDYESEENIIEAV